MDDPNDLTRSRTYTWSDPMSAAQAGRSLSGLEYMQKLLAGEFPPPPIAATMGFRLAEVEFGRAVFEIVPAEYHYNPIGIVHGGLAATLLDSALGCAIHTTLPAGTGYSTLELHVNLVRGITAQTGLLHCEGKVIHAGRQVATAEARLVDAQGKLYAHGTTTCIIFSPGKSSQ
ncbi:MAG: PaaI family thioesterase [Chloroflexi bacterium]|nr:PaaI family thioesterase [Chloroflexota bacterium]OJV95962.1 MAG: aromatic compound degradation protein PaaI [Chloroflexi bacterium 54-19]